jgi:aspartyl-tRNA synthetase
VRLKRTNNCGELRLADKGTDVVLSGWVHRRRDHGGLIFIDLRDRWGLTQVVFDPVRDPDAHKAAESIRSEFVISVHGTINSRAEGMANPKLPTGEIEVDCDDVEILNRSEPVPFPLDDYKEVGEEVRLTYRYLDLRRDEVQQNMLFRSKVAAVARNFLIEQEFAEIETPFLMKSTPEGARDFLVPSRRTFGEFYALPQSPQLYKQLLMVSGFDRYFQITKCFRDEDLRRDRQPEFTQIDLEMSFVEEEDVLNVIESLTVEIFDKTMGMKIPTPFPRLTYNEAMDRYGNDKPDIRFGMKMIDMREAVANCDFKVFKSVVESGGLIKAINVKGGAALSRSKIDGLIAYAQKQGAGGLAWMKMTEGGLESNIVKFFGPDVQKTIIDTVSAEAGDLVVFIADKPATANRVLGAVRLKLGEDLGLIDPKTFTPLFVTEFPMFERDEETKRLTAMHHPFTKPFDEDIPLLESDPLKVRSKAYDFVLNGSEIVSGSIRVHDSDLQMKLFRALGISEEEADEKFGFLLTAFKYGTPPHGGAAFGFDRFVMLLRGATSIREVIAFPKTNQGMSLMDGTPATVSTQQLRDLGLNVIGEDEA